MIEETESAAYVLLTAHKTYFVEYLIGELILSSSIDQAMVFSDLITAQAFQRMLVETCKLKVSVNTFIK